MSKAVHVRGELDLCSDPVVDKEDPSKNVPAGQLWSAGDGVVLRYTNADLKRIEQEFGDAWFGEMINSFLRGTPSIDYILKMVAHGAKKDRKPYEIPEEELDYIPIFSLGEKVFDAAFMAMRGVKSEEGIKSMYAEIADKSASPLLNGPDSTSSTSAEDKPSGQDLDQPSSGS